MAGQAHTFGHSLSAMAQGTAFLLGGSLRREEGLVAYNLHAALASF